MYNLSSFEMTTHVPGVPGLISGGEIKSKIDYTMVSINVGATYLLYF